MKSKKLLEVSAEVATGLEESAGTILEGLFGSRAVIYHDLETNLNRVSVYVPATGVDRTAKRRELRQRLSTSLAPGAEKSVARISIRQLKPTDWAESWKRHFKPIEIPGKLLIKPSWSRRKPRNGARILVLDPGLSFGTGHHPTTRFCLEQLASARHDRGRQSFLDIGTGTGILAIAAAKLGYAPVHAFDYDPDSIRIARDNAKLNCTPDIELARRDLTKLARRGAMQYDVVCANLTYDLLITQSRRVVELLKPDGYLILAGILTSQFHRVEATFEKFGMKRQTVCTEMEWMSGVFRFDVRGK